MIEIQLVSVFTSISSFELGAKEKSILNSSINQVEILNSIDTKISFFHFKISVVQRIFIVNFKAKTINLIVVGIDARRFHLEFKTSFIGIYITIHKSIAAYFHFRDKHFYNFVVDIEMKIYILIFLYFIRIIVGIDTSHSILEYFFEFKQFKLTFYIPADNIRRINCNFFDAIVES